MSIFTIDGNSSDYGWGATQDGKGIVVWKGDWFEIIEAGSQIQFNDGIAEDPANEHCVVKEIPVVEEPPVVEHDPIGGDGKIWGDPHFVGADGGIFDVHGEHGKVYNVLSDAGIQVNGQVADWLSSGMTIFTAFGVVTDGHEVSFNKAGKLVIDGKAVAADGSYLDGTVVKAGNKLTLDTGEYELTMTAVDHVNGKFMNVSFDSDNVVADGVLPHGLWGQTADGDGIARTGDLGVGAQGGGAIEDANGNLTKAGDTEAYKSYEVDGLFDTDFVNHNKYNDVPTTSEEEAVVADVTIGGAEEDAVTFEATESSLKLDGNSSDFGWGATEDGEGLIVWKGDWFKFVEAGTQLEFDDQTVDTAAKAEEEAAATEDNDTFVIDGDSSDYGWGATEDGKGYVVWNDESFDLLFDVENIQFADMTVELEPMVDA